VAERPLASAQLSAVLLEHLEARAGAAELLSLGCQRRDPLAQRFYVPIWCEPVHPQKGCAKRL